MESYQSKSIKLLDEKNNKFYSVQISGANAEMADKGEYFKFKNLIIIYENFIG